MLQSCINQIKLHLKTIKFNGFWMQESGLEMQNNFDHVLTTEKSIRWKTEK